jgi:sn-glycerol 3-phosphate transport system substrate-binding protein
MMNAAGTETYFDKPEVIEALTYWVDLGRKHKVMSPGVVEWGTTPKDFFEKKAAMIWTTTGNLTNVKTNAKFDFGVAMLPESKRAARPPAAATSTSSRRRRRTSSSGGEVRQWMTAPGARRALGHGHGLRRGAPDAWQTAKMTEYVKGFPVAAVARDQLQYSVAELSTHDNQRVTKALNDGLQAALTGAKTPEQAMKDAQAEATRILRHVQALTQLVIFDCDGVLVDSEPIANRVFARSSRRTGWRWSPMR